MTALLQIFFFVLGLTIGSFLNVIVARYHTARSFSGRSICMSCNKKLCWYELIPLVSFLALRGRCFACKTRISKFYPLVEFFTGLLFLTLFLKFENLFWLDFPNFALTYSYYAFLFSVLIIIAVYDLKHKIIPDLLSFTLFLVSFAGIFFIAPEGNTYIFDPRLPGLLELVSGLIVASPFALFWLVSKGEWMGLGDAKLAVGLGYMLGLNKAFSALVLSFWFGAVLGILLVALTRKYGMKSELPFAPFLVFASLFAFIFEIYLFPFFSF